MLPSPRRDDDRPNRPLARALAQVSPEKVPDLLPAVDGLGLPVHGRVVVEEAVASVIVAVELVVLAQAFEFGFMLVDLFGGGRAVFVAEEAKERA
jgi:hypothetical protein